jgi:Leucine-rich repeat (LRR) protein
MGLTSLDVSFFPHLVDLSCRGNQIAELDLSANPQLRRLECRDNLLRTLDVSENPSLYEFWASPMSDPYGNNLLESLYVAKGQEIPYVTKDRSVEHLPAQTKIVTK